ncbi:uncharacterized protein LOC132593050 isoform X10 [Zootoca vivipara]|uniref:uncharacterized protein LOC132593050 isoform X10 n=1 Tax=Zootoca vivipara TaxID=8524 RepID=UPI00293BACC6|nr:uncharacterized protein LOC132593050 isoform X10 [Zootoca vivipara]
MMSHYEIISKGRKQLIDILQKNIDCVLDELRLETVITKEEYEGLEKYEDSKKKSRELLILIQEKGEAACCQFLECLEVACPGSNHALHVQKHECLPPVEKPESPRVLGETEEAVPKERIIRDLQPLLDNDSSLSQALGGRPFIAYRQPPNLNQLLTHNNTTTRLNMDTGTRACNEPRCQLCCHIHLDNIITGPNNIQHTISGLFNCSSSNIVYAIKCQQCPSALYIGQTGQTLRQRINGHKSDIRNHKTEKPVGEHFNLPGHSIQDLKAAVLLQENFRNRQEREDAKLELITKLKTMEPPGMN